MCIRDRSDNNKNFKEQKKSLITSFLSRVAQKNTKLIYGTSILVIIISIVGISKLEVENSFINYFDKKTEIYKGMKLIDEELGGTTPLNVIIKFPNKSEEDDLDDDWGEEDEDDSKYWFTRDKIDKITLVHDYLENIDSIGKVISFASIVRVAEDLTGGKKLEGL